MGKNGFFWSLLGYVLIICISLLSLIFSMLVLLNVAKFINYTIISFLIGGLVSLVMITLIYKLAITLITKFEV